MVRGVLIRYQVYSSTRTITVEHLLREITLK